jgi:hypothetical protein
MHTHEYTAWEYVFFQLNTRPNKALSLSRALSLCLSRARLSLSLSLSLARARALSLSLTRGDHHKDTAQFIVVG